MKKLAIGLFGIHYMEDLNHWMHWINNVDYSETYDNNKEYLYNDFEAGGNMLEFYSATYKSPKEEDIKRDYQFRALSLQKVDNSVGQLSSYFVRRNRIFKKTIKLILDNKTKDYDFVILTRYDMNFIIPIIDMNIDFNKINLLYKAKWGDNSNLCDDNFYFMPYSKLQYFYDVISSLDETISSHLYHLHIDPAEINYMTEGAYYSHESPVYRIHRTHKTDN
jgi:hypothetical protein